MLRRRFHRLLGHGALAALAVCAGLAVPTAAQAADTGKLSVVATTGMLADTVREIGGDRVEVTALMGVGVDPHTYRQTRSDVAKLTRAKLIVWHGLHLEAQLEDLFKDLARRNSVVALADTIPKTQLLADEQNPQIFDPHVWMDPQLWQPVVTAARDALIQIDPAGKATYERNAARYAEQVAALDKRVKARLGAVPAAKRMLVTAHDAFRYFGRANGYEVLGIQGISTESEASLHQVEKLVGILVERKIGAIFVESSVSDQNIRALVEGAAARGHKVSIGGELFSDAMGQPGTPEGTYLGMIEHNANTIAKALGATP
jgi:manganese/zinc/iron transport system substrate-binding protein